MNRKILPSVALGVLLLTGCAVPSNIPGNTADMYPDLPDNEYCFRKIADYQCSASNRDNIETTVQITPDGKKKEWRTITPGYTLEGYLGILEGRGAIRKHNIIVSALQSQKIFTSSSKTPDFIVEMTGTWNADPAQYRIFTVYFKPENEARMLEWLEKLIPYSTHLKHAPNTLFIEKNPDCILLEHVSPELIEYAWKTRQGDIGKVEGLEKRMAGAPDELVKYIAQMRKWAEFDKKTPLLFQNAEECVEIKISSDDLSYLLLL